MDLAAAEKVGRGAKRDEVESQAGLVVESLCMRLRSSEKVLEQARGKTRR